MRRPLTYFLTAGMLSTALAFATWSSHRLPESLSHPLEQIPSQVGEWHQVQTQQLSPSIQQVLRATSYVSRTYTNGRTQLDLFVAYYAMQRAGESMHSPKHCLPGAGWDISQHGHLTLPYAGKTVTLNKYGIQKGSEHLVALYWYQSKDRVIADEYRAKCLLVWDGITKGRTAGSIVRIITHDDPHSSEQADNFAELMLSEMQRCLGPRQ